MYTYNHSNHLFSNNDDFNEDKIREYIRYKQIIDIEHHHKNVHIVFLQIVILCILYPIIIEIYTMVWQIIPKNVVKAIVGLIQMIISFVILFTMVRMMFSGSSVPLYNY